MSLAYIFETFKAFELNVDKVSFLKELKSMDLTFDINYDKLISYWELQA